MNVREHDLYALKAYKRLKINNKKMRELSCLSSKAGYGNSEKNFIYYITEEEQVERNTIYLINYHLII